MPPTPAGVWTQPIFMTLLKTNGNVLAEFIPETTEVERRNSFVMTKVFPEQSIKEQARLRFRYGFKNDIGGKTGTTQNNRRLVYWHHPELEPCL